MELLERMPSENSRSYALRVLKYNIVNLELTPGSAVSENVLASQMNVSRTPVREALIELSHMDLVTILPQRGSYVAKMDYGMIEEAQFIRLVLENAILELVCKGISEEYIQKLEKNLTLEEKYVDGVDNEEFMRLDNEFHQLLFAAADKQRTFSLVSAQMVHFDRFRELALKAVSSAKIVEDHKNILQAVKAHDQELAQFLMKRHLTRHLEERVEVVAKYPDYFVDNEC